jgi:translocation and assembly module TamB
MRRWVRRLAMSLAALVAAVVVVVSVLLHSLDRPWLKRRLVAAVRTSAGVDVDYGSVRVEVLSGVTVEGLVVQSPAEARGIAPDLIRIGRVEVRWSPGSLFGHGPVIERLHVSDVALTLIVDEHGRSSLDALSTPGAKTTTSAPTPLSRAASLLDSAPPVREVDVEGVALALVRTETGQESERTELRGVSLAIHAAAEPGTRGWRVDAGLGSQSAPLDLGLTQERAGTPSDRGRAKLWLALDVTSSALNATLDARLVDQTFAPSIPGDNGAHAEVHVRFDPAAGTTRVSLEHFEAGNGAATAEASVEIPDTGDPVVHHAQGDVDLARLLHWIPAGLLPVPVSAEHARIRYQIDSLVAGAVPQMSEDGKVALDADLSGVGVGLASGPLRFGGATLALRAQPGKSGGIEGNGTLHLAGTQVELGKDRLDADDVSLDLEGEQGSDGVVAGHATLRFARVEREGLSPFVAREGHLDLRATGVHPDEPRIPRGDLTLSFDLASLEARAAGTRAFVEGLTLHAHTTLDVHPPYGIELDAPMSRLRVIGRDGKLLGDVPARLEVRARDVLPDAARPATSRGVVHLAVDLGDVHASLDATKAPDSVDFALQAAAASLMAIRPWLPPALIGAAPWQQMAIVFRSSGRVEHLGGGDLSLAQTTQLDVARPAFGRVAARSLSLSLKSQGTTQRHQANVDMRLQGLSLDGEAPRDDHLTLAATVDREHPSIQLQLTTEGRATTKLAGSLSFDPARRALLYSVDGHLAGLAPVAPFVAKIHGLDALDLSQLAIDLSARGALFGVVAGVTSDGTIVLEPSPMQSVAVEGSTEIHASGLRWAQGDTAIATPSLAWHGEMHASGGRRTLDSRLEVGTVHLDLGAHDVDLNGIRDEATAVLVGNLADAEVELTQHLAVHAVAQDLVPEYPLGDIDFSVSAERGLEGVVHISDMKVANGLGGTTLAVTGNVDLGEGRRTLSVTASLTQDLAHLSTIPDRFKGRGNVAVDASVTSPDLAHYRLRSVLKAQDVTLALRHAGVDVDTANGEVPITVALEVGGNGVALQRSESRSPYSMLRFADQHPLLARSGFLSIAALKTPFVSIAPLVGNLEIDQNVVSLRQFEMGVRRGSITGQCGVDWEGAKSTLELHVRASGVQSSHGEPFDGNIAVVINAGDRTVEGRAEILRIGERHLLDLLDLQDPSHVDPGINRIRTALNFGYPDSLRLIFDHGFASAHLELGGLARLVSIGDLRGIPMGPIVDKMLAPVLDGPYTKETP